MNDFFFSQTHQITESEYLGIHRMLSKKKRPFRLALTALLGILCLFWVYTLLLGLAVLLLLSLLVVVPRVVPNTAAHTFATMGLLQGPLTYTVSDSLLSVRGETIDLSFGWENVTVWRESGDWFLLMAQQMPVLYFRIHDLRQEGVYEPVLELATRHGVEFGSPRVQ